MATVKSISVSVSRKVSQNYNSTDVTCGVTVDLEPSEDEITMIDYYTGQMAERVRAGHQSLRAAPNGASA